MHISDGVLSAPVWAGSYLVTAAIAVITSRKMNAEDLPKTAVMTSVFFVASLVHIPIGPTSIHLILNGLVGMMLGPMAFVSILLGLALQALLFQHGGITTIGANTLTMGLPAFLAYKIFDLHQKVRLKLSVVVFAAIAAACAIAFSAFLLALFLIATGDEFITVAKIALLAHFPVMIIEAIITGFIALFLMRVKPELLERRKK